MQKKYFIKTYGCAANVVDSEKFAAVLENLGFKKAKSLKDCDVFIINTCSVRQKSEDKVYGVAQKLRDLKKKPFVVLAGCMVGSALGDRKRYPLSELKVRMPWVDAFISPGDTTALVELLKASVQPPRPVRQAGHEEDLQRCESSHAYVNISTGCDNFCSYCVVPYARGKEISRPKKEILKEVESLAKKSVSEITLCAQNVNSWGLSKDEKFKIRMGSNQKLPFAKLLREVHDIAGIKKVEFLSSNPFDFTNDLVKALKLPKISNYLHIAVQSGNNDILKCMCRRHTVEAFVSLVEKIRRVRPDMTFGTDIIVGFPGETKEQFMDTVKLFQEIKFEVAYISMYSERKGTKAAEVYEDDVSLKEKKRRHRYLTKVWKERKKVD